MNSINTIEQGLKLRHVTADKGWIKACVKWIEENLGRNVTVEQLKTAVYDQWLYSDLREIGSSSFPNSINAEKTVLNGNYMVQVMGVRDISQPAYGQLLKSQGKENENANVAAAPANSVPVWEAKSKRMLLLSITDGVEYLQAMEYQPIPSLSVDMPPGSKILLSGPIECRLKVLMLKPEMVKFLGGDVEGLSDINSYENILARQLNRPEMASTQDRNTTIRPPPVSNVQGNQEMQIVDDFGDDDDIFMGLAPNYLEDLEKQNGETSTIQNGETTCGRPTIQNGETSTIQNGEPSTIPEYIDVDNDFSSYGNSSCEWNGLSNRENSRILNYSLPEAHSSLGPTIPMPIDHADPAISSTKPRAVKESSSTSSFKSDINGWESVPFTYLHCIMEQQTSTEPFVIKGFVSSLTSKLTLKPDSGWRLQALINDGSASVEVTISNEVLSKFIGLTAEDVSQLKQESRTNPNIKSKINEGIVKCQEMLMNLNCLMKVQLKPEPTLLCCAPFERYHIRQLLNRIVSH